MAMQSIEYTTFDSRAREKFRVAFLPRVVTAGGKPLSRLAHTTDLDQQEGYTVEMIDASPGVLQISP